MLLGTHNAKSAQGVQAPTLIVDGVDVRRRGDRMVLRADVDGDEVWYSFFGLDHLEARAEPFIAAALFPAMAAGRSIEVRGAPMSARLAESLDAVQRVIKLWNPEAQLIEIVADTARVKPASGVVSTSFSGGIDSMCTLIRHRGDITHLLSINGFDGMDEDDWSDAERLFLQYADRLNRQPILIDSNLFYFLESRKISWRYAHGSVLAGVKGAIGVDRGYIASTFTGRDLGPWGSHPILDPLWSTESTEIVHDAIELTRSDKVAVVASDPALLAQTQVCWRSKVNNCGECSKCVRTMLALKLLDAGPGPFPPHDPVERLGKLRPVTDLEAAVVWDLWKLAERRGESELAARLETMLQRYKLRRASKKFAKELFGRRVTRVLHRIRGDDWADEPLLLGDPTDFK